MKAFPVGQLPQRVGAWMKDSSRPGINAKPARLHQTADYRIGVPTCELAASATRAYPQQPVQTGPNAQFGKTVVKSRGVNR